MNSRPMTVKELHDAVRWPNGPAPPAQEGVQWTDFVHACCTELGFPPWDEAHWGDSVPEQFALHWLTVAEKCVTRDPDDDTPWHPDDPDTQKP